MPIPDTPYTRKESYLNAIATGDSGGIPETPYTREEMYLDYIARNGGGSSTLSGLTDVDISNPTDGQTLVYNATSGKWENGAGGGSGGILYVGMDMSTFTLDKTWQEIYDSDLSVLKIEAPDGSSKDAYMLSTAYIEGTEGVNASYGVTFYCITTEDSQPSMEAMSFSASTRNDYPAINSPE